MSLDEMRTEKFHNGFSQDREASSEKILYNCAENYSSIIARCKIREKKITFVPTFKYK
jgi:hypothetical protein